jgi:hypothetical protein
MAILTPSHHPNRVTADIVDNPQKSKKSMISKIVGIVDKVKLTTRPGPTYATNDPYEKHYKLKDAFQNLHKTKSTFSKIRDALSRKNTGHNKKNEMLENKLFERSRSSSSRKGRRSSS